MNHAMSGTIRVVSYLNQFFAGLGGEEAASTAPHVVDGAVGSAKLLDQLLDGGGQEIGRAHV